MPGTLSGGDVRSGYSGEYCQSHGASAMQRDTEHRKDYLYQ